MFEARPKPRAPVGGPPISEALSAAGARTCLVDQAPDALDDAHASLVLQVDAEHVLEVLELLVWPGAVRRA